MSMTTGSVDLRISPAAARVNAGLTQKQAAERIGIGIQSIKNYESGASIPRWDVALKMAEVYGLLPANIFFGKHST